MIKNFATMSNQALAYLLRCYTRCDDCDDCPCKDIVCSIGPDSNRNTEKEFLFEIVKRLED